MASGNDYEVLEVIGQGSFGQIRKVRRKHDGLILVRKEISYVKMSQKEREQLQTEFQLLATLKHPNIVEYFHRDHIKSDSMLHLYMEYCGNGDLSQVIKQCQQEGTLVPEHLVWSIFAQIVLALFRCHWGVDPPSVNDGDMVKPPIGKAQFTVLHRDLKPENVFLDQDNSVKLGDFGLSKLLHGDHHFATTYVGTPFYMSPELIKDLPYTSKSDIWSLGCVIYELCKLSPPFNAKTHFNLCQKIKEGKYPQIPPQYSSELRCVIAECLQIDPKQRPDTARLLNVPSIKLARRESEVYQIQRTLKMEKEKLRLREQQLILKEQELTKEWTERGKRLDIELRNKWAAAAEAEVAKRVEAELQNRISEALAIQLPKLVEEEIARRLATLDIPLPSDDDLTAAVAAVPTGEESLPPSPTLRLIRRKSNKYESNKYEESNPPSPRDIDMVMSPAPALPRPASSASSRRRSAGTDLINSMAPPPIPDNLSASHNPNALRRPGPFSATTAPGKAQGNMSTNNMFSHEATLQKLMHKTKPSIEEAEFSPLRTYGSVSGQGHTNSAPNLPGMLHNLSVQESPTQRVNRRKQMGSSNATQSSATSTATHTTHSTAASSVNALSNVLQPIQQNTLSSTTNGKMEGPNRSGAMHDRNFVRGKSLVELAREAKLASEKEEFRDGTANAVERRGLKVRIEGMLSEAPARWDSEVDEMPSPFLRKRRMF